MPNLEEVSFQGVSLRPDRTENGGDVADLRGKERLRTLHLGLECRLPHHLYFPAKLQDLRIYYLNHSTYTPPPVDTPLTRLVDLRTLDLRIREWPQYLELGSLPTEDETRLSELSLDMDFQVNQQGLEFLEHGCVKRLSHLTLRCQSLKDPHSATFIKHMPNLETLTIGDASITGVFIMDLVQATACRLREIHLQSCANVSRDVVPWAKSRGVRITMAKDLDAPRRGQRTIRAHY